MNNFVILASYRDLIEAEIVKGHLEAEGIQCVLTDDNTVAVNPFYSNAVGGVKLKVFQEDYDKAIAIIGTAKDVPVDEDDVLTSRLMTPLQSTKGILIFIAVILVAALLLYAVYIKIMKTL